jgi:hypothetical protein
MKRPCETKGWSEVHYVPDDCEKCLDKCKLYALAKSWGAKKWKKEDKIMGMAELQFDIHENAVAHGFHNTKLTFPEFISLIHCEASETFEEYRKHHSETEIYFNPEDPTKPEGIPVELVDIAIRLMDWFEDRGLDMEKIIRMKHEYNKTRSYRHGGKVC